MAPWPRDVGSGLAGGVAGLWRPLAVLLAMVAGGSVGGVGVVVGLEPEYGATCSILLMLAQTVAMWRG